MTIFAKTTNRNTAGKFSRQRRCPKKQRRGSYKQRRCPYKYRRCLLFYPSLLYLCVKRE